MSYFENMKVCTYHKLPKDIQKLVYDMYSNQEYGNGSYIKYNVGFDNYIRIDEELKEKCMNEFNTFCKQNGCVDGDTILISFCW